MAVPALVTLAAGVGRRYGGRRQIEPLGPAGATLLDYGIYDALRAGFGTVVLVIRDDLEPAVRATIGARWGGGGGGGRGAPGVARRRGHRGPARPTGPPPPHETAGAGHAGRTAAAPVQRPAG